MSRPSSLSRPSPAPAPGPAQPRMIRSTRRTRGEMPLSSPGMQRRGIRHGRRDGADNPRLPSKSAKLHPRANFTHCSAEPAPRTARGCPPKLPTASMPSATYRRRLAATRWAWPVLSTTIIVHAVCHQRLPGGLRRPATRGPASSADVVRERTWIKPCLPSGSRPKASTPTTDFQLRPS